MKWIEVLEKFTDRPLFHSSMLRIFPDSPSYIQVQLSRWVDAGRLIQIRREWYLIAKPYRHFDVPPPVIANTVVLPSYLSLEWVLSFYGNIPAEVPNPTSVTSCRADNFRAAGRLFIYRHIKPGYFIGYHRIREGDFDILVAYPEKALWDLLYYFLRGHRFDLNWLKELRLQNMERFNFSRWDYYSEMGPRDSFRRACRKVEEYIREEIL